MYIFVKALAVQTLEGGIGIVVNNKLIADTTGTIGNIKIIEQDVDEIRINGYPLVFVKYIRASSGHFDEENNWHWDLVSPFVNSDNQLIIKYHKSSFTRKELLDIIAEFEFDGGRIPNPLGLLSRFFDELRYPCVTNKEGINE